MSAEAEYTAAKAALPISNGETSVISATLPDAVKRYKALVADLRCALDPTLHTPAKLKSYSRRCKPRPSPNRTIPAGGNTSEPRRAAASGT